MNVYLIFPHGSTLALGVKQKEKKIHVGYFFDPLFGDLNHFGKTVLHLVSKQKKIWYRVRKLRSEPGPDWVYTRYGFAKFLYFWQTSNSAHSNYHKDLGSCNK